MTFFIFSIFYFLLLSLITFFLSSLIPFFHFPLLGKKPQNHQYYFQHRSMQYHH